MNAFTRHYQKVSRLLLCMLACGLAGAGEKENVRIYLESGENTKTGIWLKRAENQPEFLYQVKVKSSGEKARVDIGERPKLLAASMVLDNDRVALVVNNTLLRDARLILVIVKRDNNGEWRVVKEQGVLEKRDFQIKVPPQTVQSVKLSTTKEGKIRIECPVEGIGKVKGEDGVVRLRDTGIRKLVEEVDP